MNRTTVNIACSILVLTTNVLINIFLSPIIVATLGAEANGFVSLANNCVTYAQLLATALGSMASRFITIERARGNYEKARLYYNSIFWGNLVLALVLFVPAVICVVKLQLVFDVPTGILGDVKLLFAFIFANFLITTALPKYECGPFAVNRLDRSYIPQAVGQIIRCAVVFSMFALFAPHVWYVGLAASIMTGITLAANAHYAHILTPELRVGFRKGRRCFSLKALKELFLSGVWNSIQNLGAILTNGLDSLVANVLLGATAMGSMSLSKTLPTLMSQLSSSICNALAPELTIDWASGNREKMLANIDRAMKLTACVMTVPLSGIIVFGDSFYRLWVPSEDAGLLWALSVLSVLGYIFTSGVQILYNVFTAVNKVRSNAIAVLVSGTASIVITLVLVRTTPLGLYAVSGVSSVVSLVRNLAFMLPVTASYLGCKWYQFYRQVLRSNVSVVVLLAMGFFVKVLMPEGSWALFLLAVTMFAALGFMFNIVFLLTHTERELLKKVIKVKLHYTQR